MQALKSAQQERFDLRNRLFKKENRFFFITLLVMLIGMVIIAVKRPSFYSLNNLKNVLIQNSSLCVMSIGLTFILITGGIDISMPKVMCLAAVTSATLMRASGSVVVGVLTMFAVAVVCGAINGLAVSRFRMLPFIVTLAMQIMADGAATLISQSRTIPVPAGFAQIANGKIGPVPNSITIMLAIIILAYFVLHRTKFGRWVYAIGVNKKTAYACGIPVDMVVFAVYVIGAATTAIGGIILMARLGGAVLAMASDTTFLDIICGAVVGGVSIYGGVGTIWGAVFGSLFVIILGNFLNLFGVEYFTALMIKGGIILLTTCYDTLRKKVSKKEG